MLGTMLTRAAGGEEEQRRQALGSARRRLEDVSLLVIAVFRRDGGSLVLESAVKYHVAVSRSVEIGGYGSMLKARHRRLSHERSVFSTPSIYLMRLSDPDA